MVSLGGIGNLLGGIGSIAAPIVGGVMQSAGVQQTNAQIKAMMREQYRHTLNINRKSYKRTSRMAGEQRDWSSDEARRARGFNRKEARKSRRWSRNEAERSRAWQKEMSDTAMQRRVADMKAAGINPIYGAMSQGASSPPGAQGQTTAAQTASPSGAAGAASSVGAPGPAGAPQNEFGGMMNSAIAANRAIQETMNMRTANKGLAADAKRKEADARAAEYHVSSAKSQATLDELSAKRAHEYGGSKTGQEIFSYERMLKRFGDWLFGEKEEKEPLEIPIHPGYHKPKGLLPDEKYGGFE